MRGPGPRETLMRTATSLAPNGTKYPNMRGVGLLVWSKDLVFGYLNPEGLGFTIKTESALTPSRGIRYVIVKKLGSKVHHRYCMIRSLNPKSSIPRFLEGVGFYNGTINGLLGYFTVQRAE